MDMAATIEDLEYTVFMNKESITMLLGLAKGAETTEAEKAGFLEEVNGYRTDNVASTAAIAEAKT